MQSNIAVSIIIPNYNHALYLKQRIDSVLNQTFQDFELIILDDCSTDSSRKIIELYHGNPKITQIIYNEKNSGGVFKQWIKGIEKAKGEYVWIAESDDYSADTFLEETMKVLKNDPALGMVFTNSNTVTNKGAFLTTTAESKNGTYAKLATDGNIIDRYNVSSFLISEMIIENAGCVLFRKKSLLSLNFSELEKYINTGDRFAYVGIALNAQVRYIPKALNFMRSHEHNTTKKSFENGNIHKDRLRVLNYYFNDMDNYTSNRENIVAFYKSNYLSFIHYGEYQDNITLLRKLKERKEIRSRFYQLVWFNLFLFKKANIQSKILKGLYYRILVQQKLT